MSDCESCGDNEATTHPDPKGQPQLCADCGKTQDAFDAIAAAVEVAYNSGVTLGDVQDIARDMWPDGCNPNGG